MAKGIKTETTPRSLLKPVTWILIIGGLVGLISSFVITWDKLQLLEHPGFRPNCDLNPIISCGSVMSSHQSSAFAFPNSWIGLSAFAVLITIGMGILAGAKYKRWFWLCLQAGAIVGFGFAVWLLLESIYHINALCPYCLAVDVAVFSLTWYLTLYNIEAGHIRLPAALKRPAAFARRHHIDVLILTFVVVIVMILNHFWYYYGHYF